MHHVYKFTNRQNGKIYVGKSNNVARRQIEHLSSSKTEENNYFHNAIKKYGLENFDLEIVASFDDEEKAYEAEIEFISEFQSNDRKKGYNSTPGGEGVRMMSEETRNKISKARMGKYTGKDNSFYGREHTQETKNKISKANKGRAARFGKKLTKEAKEKISKANAGVRRSIETEFKPGHTPKSAKITMEQAREIREKYKSGMKIKQLEKDYDLSNSQIWKIISNQSFKENK